MATASIMQSQGFSIGGIVRPLTPYQVMVAFERNVPNPKTGLFAPLSAYQYISMLLNNLGYKRTSSDVAWVDAGQPIENVHKDAVLDYPLTYHRLMINQEKDSLWNVLEAIRNWGRAPSEQGVLLDQMESFKLPDPATIQYNIQNGIAVRRNATVMITPMSWTISDIFSRRLHNICPQINLEYFNNCIRNFEDYVKQIIIDRPYAMFTAAMINPDIVMSMIKNAEMEAAKSLNKKVGGYAAFRPDFDTAKKFAAIFAAKNNHLINIFYKRGPKGFVEMRKLVSQGDLEKKLTLHNNSYVPPQIAPEDDFSHLSIEEKRQVVADFDINEARNIACQFVDINSFSNSIIDGTTVTDERGNAVKKYSDEYAPIIKRIARIVKQINIYYPELLNNKTKWIFSKPFYLNPDAFALFSQKDKLFILAYPDMELQILEPQDAIKRYRERYGKEVVLDPEEMGDVVDAPECKDVMFLENIEPDPSYVIPDDVVPLTV